MRLLSKFFLTLTTIAFAQDPLVFVDKRQLDLVLTQDLTTTGRICLDVSATTCISTEEIKFILELKKRIAYDGNSVNFGSDLDLSAPVGSAAPTHRRLILGNNSFTTESPWIRLLKDPNDITSFDLGLAANSLYANKSRSMKSAQVILTFQTFTWEQRML